MDYIHGQPCPLPSDRAMRDRKNIRRSEEKDIGVFILSASQPAKNVDCHYTHLLDVALISNSIF